METSPVYLDLHIHSSFSDGALSPAELVARAKQNGLRAIALADHDSVAGVAQATAAGVEQGVEVIPAVELSVVHKDWQDIHLLAYGLNYMETEFLKKLSEFKERREDRNITILKKVNERLSSFGKMPEITLTEVLTHAKDSIGRPHIARALLERGHVSSIEEAFCTYLVPCNVPKEYWAIEDAIMEIKRIGGIAVLAHPTSISSDRQELRRVLIEMKDLGLEGLEVYNNMTQPENMEYLRRFADKHDLLVSAGSDFHGIEAGLEMGRGRGGIRFNDTLITPLWKRLADRKGQFLSL